MPPRNGILTYGDDVHGHIVKKKLEQRHDAWSCLIPSDEFALRGGLSWSSEIDEPARVPTIDGQGVDVRTLNALWYRRTTVTQALPDDVDEQYALHIYRSVERVVEGILLNDFHGRWVSHPVATRLAENK